MGGVGKQPAPPVGEEMARNGLAHDEPYIWDGRYLKFNGEMVHRLVWEETKGAIPDSMLVHHKNGDRLDNRVENLELITRAEHCKLHRPRLGHCSPTLTLCRVCGQPRNSREMLSNPHRHVCNKCRGKEDRRKEKHVSFV